MRSRSRWIRVTAALAMLAGVAACDYVHPPFLDSLDAPVVLTGADVPGALGLDPARVVAFRWNDGWTQVPVQVDQRVVVPFGSQPPSNTTPGVVGSVYGYGSGGVTALQYADPNTFVGADTDPLVDADDELVFLARDAGARVPPGTTRPAAAVAQGREVRLTDADGSLGYVYLFLGRAGVDPSAGEDLVDYDFDLVSGDYATTYKRADGPNPERSSVTAETYAADMVDRWKTVNLRIDGSPVDILDGFKARFSFETCGRSNATFAEAEGAFAANIDGPIRGIRSYVGANSGPLTQETWFFYPDRIEQVVDLRVHAIPGVMSFIDLSTAADGMHYGNSTLGEQTVVVDGEPDSVPTTNPAWHHVGGPQGVMTWTDFIETDAGLGDPELLWTDDATPPFDECWGSGGLWGSAVTSITEPIPNTDPRSSPAASFRARRVLGLWPAALDAAAWAPVWAAAVRHPIVPSVAVGP